MSNRPRKRTTPGRKAPGRSRRKRAASRSVSAFQKTVRTVFGCIVAACITAVAVFVVCYVFFPVNGLDVRGTRAIPKSEVRQAVPERSSIPLLSSRNLERRLKANPLVKDVVVLKDWQSGIVAIEIEERRAVLDGDLGGREVVIAQDGTRLSGTGEYSLETVRLDKSQLQEVLTGVRALDKGGVALESIDRVDAGGVHATVGGDGRGDKRRVVFAGDIGEGQVQVLKGLINRRPEASYFDLRAPRRVVVGDASDESGT